MKNFFSLSDEDLDNHMKQTETKAASIATREAHREASEKRIAELEAEVAGIKTAGNNLRRQIAIVNAESKAAEARILELQTESLGMVLDALIEEKKLSPDERANYLGVFATDRNLCMRMLGRIAPGAAARFARAEEPAAVDGADYWRKLATADDKAGEW